jgi:dTDP-glucose pyrophosphorylase
MTKPFEACRVQLGQPLRRALLSLDVSALGLVVVEDAAGRVVGTLTDGDIRRAFLKGAQIESLVDEYVQRQFRAVGATTSRAEVLDLMQSQWLSQIPILDAEGRLIGLHTLHQILGATPRPNWAIVMAGGRGERLRPLTDSIPKPMIRVAGRPILERIVLHLVGFGIPRIFLSVNYRADLIEAHFGDGSNFGCAIEYLREDTPLGTGGALSLIPETPANPLLVLNGDLLTQFDVGSLLAFHTRGGYRATIGVHEYTHTVPFGVLDLDGDRVVQMSEKPAAAWQANAGIYCLEPDLLGRVPRQTYFPLTTLLEECLERGEAVGAFHVEEDWIDIGRAPELDRARGNVPSA